MIQVIAFSTGLIMKEKRSSLRRAQSHDEIADGRLVDVEIQRDVGVGGAGLTVHLEGRGDSFRVRCLGARQRDWFAEVRARLTVSGSMTSARVLMTVGSRLAKGL